MSKFGTIHLAMGVWVGLCSIAANAQTTDPLTFTGTVGVSAVQNNERHPDHSPMLVLTLLDANGNAIKFCNSAQLQWNAAIATSNPLAATIQQTAALAQSAGTKVTVVTSEDTTDSDGMYCGIKSLVAAQ